MALQSFGETIRAAVFGAGGGIGGAFVRALADDPVVETVHAVSRREIDAPEGVVPLACDPSEEGDLSRVADRIGADGPLHLVIAATGVLHGEGFSPEKAIRQIDAEAMRAVLHINAVIPCLIAKHMLPLLPRDRRACFAALSARVGSISDNRLGGWVSYRASKAALNMALRTFSIEMARTHPQAVILGLHPGTVDTGLSEPFRSNVPENRLFTPEHAAARMLETLDRAAPEDSGALLAYDGERIEP